MGSRHGLIHWVILLCGLYCLVAFVVVTIGVFTNQPLAEFDTAQAERLFGLGQRLPGVYDFFAWMTEFGSTRPLHFVTYGITLVLIVRRQYLLALVWVISILINLWLNVSLKDAFSRLRPLSAPQELRDSSFSFPSGHAQNSMFIYGLLMYLGCLAYPRWKWVIAIGLMFLVIVIGISRMVLGVHYFSDVLGGFLMAMTGLSLWIALIEWHRHRPSATPLSSTTTPVEEPQK
jgi:membrane-associated phospholipid phosphatase